MEIPEEIIKILNEIEELKSRLFYTVSFGYRERREKNPFVAEKLEEKKEQLWDLIKTLPFPKWKCLPENVRKKLQAIWIMAHATCPICGHELKTSFSEWGSFDHYDISATYKCPACSFEFSKDWTEPR
jgi:RNA polymerase subunit RPABC4/transcription elongation factor Spt4